MTEGNTLLAPMFAVARKKDRNRSGRRNNALTRADQIERVRARVGAVRPEDQDVKDLCGIIKALIDIMADDAFEDAYDHRGDSK